MAAETMTFYPTSTPVPELLRTPRVFLRPLRATDVDRDYDAVMSSAAMLQSWSHSEWPSDAFTRAENLEDLQRHEREHQAREAFTFTVLDPDGTRCLGCVYLAPMQAEARALCEGAAYPVRLGFWVREAEIKNDLDRHLLASLRDWLASEWRFDRVLFVIALGNSRQTELLEEAGLQPRSIFEMPDGRRFKAYS
jgi:RimJ/RimL family protein N-acetyltransferase